MANYIVTRHQGAIEWLKSQGIKGEIFEDFDPDIINPGDRVIGTLPVNLAAEVCKRGGEYLHLEINIPHELRGKELSAKTLTLLGANIRRMEVKGRMGGPGAAKSENSNLFKWVWHTIVTHWKVTLSIGTIITIVAITSNFTDPLLVGVTSIILTVQGFNKWKESLDQYMDIEFVQFDNDKAVYMRAKNVALYGKADIRAASQQIGLQMNDGKYLELTMKREIKGPKVKWDSHEIRYRVKVYLRAMPAKLFNEILTKRKEKDYEDHEKIEGVDDFLFYDAEVDSEAKRKDAISPYTCLAPKGKFREKQES